MGRDIEEIRHDIAIRRAQLRETAEAIGWKADVPARARDVVRETAAVIRERVASGSTASPLRDGSSPSVAQRVGAAVSAVTDRAGAVKDAVADGAGTAKDAVIDGAGSLKGAAGSGAHAVGETASSARDAVAGGIEGARGGAGSLSDNLPGARAGARDAARFARSNPVGVALGALAVGIAAGVLIPSTRVEQEQMAPVADELRERGDEIGRQAMERGRQAADELAEAVSPS
jgi:hypothetical protein